MVILVTCKNEYDPIKDEGVDQKQFAHCKSMGFFSDAQRQLTPQSVVESDRISNSPEILWLSSLPARIKKIRSKMKALEC